MKQEHKLSIAWYMAAYVAMKNAHSTKALKQKSKAVYTKIAQKTEQQIESDLEELIEYTVAEFEKKTGLTVDDSVVSDIVAMVVSGELYDSKWTLSKAVKGIDEKTEAIIAEIIDAGIEQGKSEDEIIQEILAILNPTDDQYQKTYTTKTGKVYVPKTGAATDTLMRTTLEHGYQQIIKHLAESLEDKKVMIRWISALAHNTCEVCESRHNQLYEPEDLPLEHPNGQCEFCIEYT